MENVNVDEKWTWLATFQRERTFIVVKGNIHLIEDVIEKAEKLIQKELTLLQIEPPMIVVGDIHGQFEDLLWIFQQTGFPPISSYLFLGDYVDRGKNSIECMTLLLSLKVKYPRNIFLLRGNHECTVISQKYGFLSECKSRFTNDLWRRFSSSFDCLSLAAIIGGKIFCCHAGLSPSLKKVEQINTIKKPYPITNLSGTVIDLLWSDPSPFHIGWKPNRFRSVSYTFGNDVIEKFLVDNDLQLIVRAHQLLNQGYQMFAGGKLLSIFSAPNYCNTHMNDGAILQVDRGLRCSIIRLKWGLPACCFTKVTLKLWRGKENKKKWNKVALSVPRHTYDLRVQPSHQSLTK